MIHTETKQQSAFQTLVIDYVLYNAWANKKLTDWLKTKPAEKMEKEILSSFPSIKKTLIHIWKSELFWLDALQRELKNADNIGAYYYQDIDISIADIFSSLEANSKTIMSFVQQLDDESIQEKVEVITPWFNSCQPRFELILHCMNHSTYHRGQIITIGRNLGYTDAPMTDFNFYLLHVK